jgi:hypothetical protein
MTYDLIENYRIKLSVINICYTYYVFVGFLSNINSFIINKKVLFADTLFKMFISLFLYALIGHFNLNYLAGKVRDIIKLSY